MPEFKKSRGFKMKGPSITQGTKGHADALAKAAPTKFWGALFGGAAKEGLKTAAKQGLKTAAKEGLKTAAKEGLKGAAKEGLKTAAKEGLKKGAKETLKKGLGEGLKKGTTEIGKKGLKTGAKLGSKMGKASELGANKLGNTKELTKGLDKSIQKSKDIVSESKSKLTKGKKGPDVTDKPTTKQKIGDAAIGAARDIVTQQALNTMNPKEKEHVNPTAGFNVKFGN